ncbi:hypothetical protein ACDY97_03940 [Rhizobium mongolense]|uniref:hypothetical protein n=1 Tax=Rhizobium mongolense TaxID=57676 RepID=UPI0035583E8B
MSNRHHNGGAADANYGIIRQPDPEIAEFIRHVLGDAKTVLNVGAKTDMIEQLIFAKRTWFAAYPP